jgi:hypothetical protein
MSADRDLSTGLAAESTKMPLSALHDCFNYLAGLPLPHRSCAGGRRTRLRYRIGSGWFTQE